MNYLYNNNKGEYGTDNKGVTHKSKSISAKFPHEIEEILLSFPNRSDYLRKAVLNQLRLDGYID